MKDRFALFGHPVAHSRSGEIHGRMGLDFELIDVEANALETTVRSFGRKGGRGANVTLPFKLPAAEFVDILSSRARLAGAVNTLRFETDGILFGDNTDGVGLVVDLTRNLGLELEGKRILVIGAGGAARGIIGPLLELSPAILMVSNRDGDKAGIVAARFTGMGRVESSPLQGAGNDYDLVINATSTSLTDELPPISPDIFSEGCIAVDLAYDEDGKTAFTHWARGHGAGAAVDGWGMLVEQAAESHLVWLGKRPDTNDLLRRGA